MAGAGVVVAVVAATAVAEESLVINLHWCKRSRIHEFGQCWSASIMMGVRVTEALVTGSGRAWSLISNLRYFPVFQYQAEDWLFCYILENESQMKQLENRFLHQLQSFARNNIII